MTLDAFIEHVRTDVFAREAAHIANHRTLAEQIRLAPARLRGRPAHGGRRCGAEGNAALNALFDNFNRDPRIKQLYLDYLAIWKREGGELFVHFNDVSRYTKSGRWGALEYVAQPRGESPKFDGLMTFIERNPVWWAP